MAEIVKVPDIDLTLIDQPFTLKPVSEELERPFNKLFRISNCGGGADLENKVWDFCEGPPYTIYTFSLDEATCQAREESHVKKRALPQIVCVTGTTAFFPGNNFQLLVELNPSSGTHSTPLLCLQLCDCNRSCEPETRIDTTILRTFVSRLQFSCGEANSFQTLSFYPACTEKYHIGRKKEPGNYKQILYYAFLKRKIMQDIFPLEVFSKDFEGPLPTIRILHPSPNLELMANPSETATHDAILRWTYYQHEFLLRSYSFEMAFDLLKAGLTFKVLDATVHSSETIIQKIESGEREWLHPEDGLWKIYEIVRLVENIEIVVVLKMTIVKALKKILMRKRKTSRIGKRTFAAKGSVTAVWIKGTDGKIKIKKITN
ncbi:unnamed protein product [Orchesella dallaii]|uniref:Uncharacterized protein n=1 Tax=Orchesella dallaii TaxID=48710 RepID=A0ABP1Q0M9_9HEXA